MQLGSPAHAARSGIEWDLRKKQPYEVYDRSTSTFRWDERRLLRRYLVRVEELRQSTRIIDQCVKWLRENSGPVMIDDRKVRPPRREEMKGDMESLIHHFKFMTEGFCVPEGEVYARSRRPRRARCIPRVRRRQQAYR